MKWNTWYSRSTVFAVFFAVTSFILALKSLLTGQYVAMCTAVQTMVVTRAVAQDYHDRKCEDKHEGSDSNS